MNLNTDLFIKSEICRELRSHLLSTTLGHLLMLGLLWVAFLDNPPNLTITLVLIAFTLLRLVLYVSTSIECLKSWRSFFSIIIFTSALAWGWLIIILVQKNEVTSDLVAITMGVLLGLNSASLVNLASSAHDFYFFQATMHLTAWQVVDLTFSSSHKKYVSLALLVFSFLFFIIQRQQRYKEWTRLIIKSKMASLGEMSGNLAHEINNILAVSQARLSKLEKLIMANDYNQAEYARIVEIVKKSSLRMGKILRGILNISRRNHSEPIEQVSIKNIIDETIPLCETRYSSQKVKLHVMDISDRIKLECRFTEISQVLINLLNNAYDAAMSGDEERWVRIRVEENLDHITLKICDSGVGFSNKINKKFFTTKTLGFGSGLGLRISEIIIKSHHGKLYFDQEDKHTCVVVELPKVQPPEDPS